MTPDVLAREAATIAQSSAYRYGDATSFSVPILGDITLPGRSAPAAWLARVGIDKAPERVLVVCPGNGGMVSEMLQRGAQLVVALEPRSRFQNALSVVLGLVAKGLLAQQNDADFRIVNGYPLTEAAQKQLGKFDLVLFTEGHEEITNPKAVFHALAQCLTPTGRLVIEITHGQNPWTDQINSWHPDGDAALAMATECFGGCWVGKHAGRRDNSRIYEIMLTGEKAAEAPKAAPKPAPKPTPPAPKPEPKPVLKKEPDPKPEPKPEPKKEAPAPEPEKTVVRTKKKTSQRTPKPKVDEE